VQSVSTEDCTLLCNISFCRWVRTSRHVDTDAVCVTTDWALCLNKGGGGGIAAGPKTATCEDHNIHTKILHDRLKAQWATRLQRLMLLDRPPFYELLKTVTPTITQIIIGEKHCAALLGNCKYF
jgi:hypothetical protein